MANDIVDDAVGIDVMQATMTRAAVIEALRARWRGFAHIDKFDADCMALEIAWSREGDLPSFWRTAGYRSVVEIGVERAHYTKHLLAALPDAKVYGVDPWLAYKGYREHVTQEKLDGFYAEAQQRIAEFGDRGLLIRAASVEAAAGFADESIDVVYIDGNHTLPFVIPDLAAWVPKVRSGGMVCGHDYGRRRVGHVREAVIAWTNAYDIRPWFLFTKDRSWSWGFVK